MLGRSFSPSVPEFFRSASYVHERTFQASGRVPRIWPKTVAFRVSESASKRSLADKDFFRNLPPNWSIRAGVRLPPCVRSLCSRYSTGQKPFGFSRWEIRGNSVLRWAMASGPVSIRGHIAPIRKQFSEKFLFPCKLALFSDKRLYIESSRRNGFSRTPTRARTRERTSRTRAARPATSRHEPP